MAVENLRAHVQPLLRAAGVQAAIQPLETASAVVIAITATTATAPAIATAVVPRNPVFPSPQPRGPVPSSSLNPIYSLKAIDKKRYITS